VSGVSINSVLNVNRYGRRWLSPSIIPFLIGAVALGFSGTQAASAAFPSAAYFDPFLRTTPIQSLVSWPQYKFSADHSGFNPVERELDAGNVASLVTHWKVGGGGGGLGGGYASSIVVDTLSGVAYASSMDGNLYALDIRNGDVLWSGATPGGGSGAPAIANGLVYVGTNSGLYAFPSSCSTPCAPQWIGQPGIAVNPSPTVDGGVVYVAAYDGYVRAFDGATGALLWWGDVNSPIDPVFFSATVANGIVYVAGDYGLFAFPTNCSGLCAPLWLSAMSVSPNGSSAVVDGVAYLARYDGFVYAIDATTGAKLWYAHVPAAPTAPAVADGTLFIGSSAGRLYAFDGAGCGAPRCYPIWTAIPQQSVFDPVVANGIVYVGSLNGIYTAGAILAYPTRCEALCNPLWTASVEGAVESALSVVNGTIYAGTLTGALYTFGLPPSWRQGGQ